MFDGFISARLFSSIREYILELIQQFGYAGLSRGLAFATSVGVGLLTIWFMVQGYRIATGQSRESMAVFMVQSVKVITVVAVAQGMAIFGQDLSALFTDWRNTIAGVITGGSYQDPSAMVGEVMSKMLILQTAMDVFQGSGVTATSNIQMANTMSFISGAGMAMPALIGGGLLLLNEIALNLCLVFGPLCMLAYVFEPTRQIFVTWVKFSITTLFSMVVITVVTVIALKALIMLGTALVTIDAGSTIVGLITGGKGGMQLRDIATVTGGLGMLLSTLVIGTPPLVTNFFSGQVGAVFSGYNQFAQFAGGKGAAAGPQDYFNRGGGAGVGANSGKSTEAGQVHAQGTAPNLSNKILGQPSTISDPNTVKTINQSPRALATPQSFASREGVASAQLAKNTSSGDSGSSGSSSSPTVSSGTESAATGSTAQEQALAAQRAQSQAQEMQRTANNNASASSASNLANTTPPRTGGSGGDVTFDSGVRGATAQGSNASQRPAGSRGLRNPGHDA